MHAYLQSRPLASAIALSLGMHAVLLMPWRHGDWLAGGNFYSGDPVTPLRLDAILKHAAPDAHAPVPAPEPMPAQATREKISIPPAPQQREIAAAEKPTGIPLAALYYYALKELDQRPVLKRPPQIDATTGGASLMVSGSAVLELLIENNGRINAVNVVRSDLPESYLLPLKDAFAAAKYSPGIKEQGQVRSRLYVEVMYRDGMFSGMDADVYAVVPPAPMGNAQANRQRKENPPLRN